MMHADWVAVVFQKLYQLSFCACCDFFIKQRLRLEDLSTVSEWPPLLVLSVRS